MDQTKAQLAARADRSPARRLWSKIWRLVVGGLVVIVGVILLPAPGPGTLIILAGLAIMAPEFPPAQRLLHWLRRRFDRVVQQAREKKQQRDDKKSNPS